MTTHPLRAVVVMGVSGAGKTTVGRRLAADLGWTFVDADDLHPASNVRKMAAGHPLDDADRAPWLAAVRQRIDLELEAAAEQDGGAQSGGDAHPGDAHLSDAHPGAVVACSALKRAYREVLGTDRPGVALVFLSADPDLLADRLRHRHGHGHFMPPGLLASQLATLESPGEDEALVVDVTPPPDQIARTIARRLRLAPH